MTSPSESTEQLPVEFSAPIDFVYWQGRQDADKSGARIKTIMMPPREAKKLLRRELSALLAQEYSRGLEDGEARIIKWINGRVEKGQEDGK